MKPVSKPIFKYARIALWAFVALASLAVLASRFTGKPGPDFTAEPVGGPFTLTAHTGETVSDSQFRGKILLIYFGFTYCPDVCPTSLQTIAAALDKLPAETRGEIQPLLISLDPERDTPEILKGYVEYFVPGMIGLTGTQDQIQEVANAYRVAFWKEKDPNSALPYTVNHASLFFIMGRDGALVKAMPTKEGPGLSPQNVGTPDNLARALEDAVAKN